MMEQIVRWIQALLLWVDDSLRVAVGAYPTLMLILFLTAGLVAGAGLSLIAAMAEEDDAKRLKRKRRRRGWRYRTNEYGEPIPPDWWETKPWWWK